MGPQPKIADPKPKYRMVSRVDGAEGLVRFCKIETRLLEEDILPFDLYFFDRERRELIPFMNMGSAFSRRTKGELLSRGIEVLYVPIKDKKALNIYVESQLPRMLKSDIPPRRKLELTYNSAQQIMEDVFSNYTDKRNIRRAKSVVSSIVDLFISQKEALSTITDLTIHDYYTYTHSLHVCLYGTAAALRTYSNRAQEIIKLLSFGFLMHDIGKAKVDPAVLKKPGGLSAEEWRQVKKHPLWSYKILEDIKELTPEVANIVLQHHERVDGSGYPSQLMGYEMGLFSRICAFADVFDAMTTERPFQKARPTYEALTIIRDQMKSMNDRNVFELFVKIFAEE